MPAFLQKLQKQVNGSGGGGESDEEDDEGETERLGVVLVTYRDGKVDICLDVEKVEAKWEHRHVS